jgi:hypothetical protein
VDDSLKGRCAVDDLARRKVDPLTAVLDLDEVVTVAPNRSSLSVACRGRDIEDDRTAAHEQRHSVGFDGQEIESLTVESTDQIVRIEWPGAHVVFV